MRRPQQQPISQTYWSLRLLAAVFAILGLFMLYNDLPLPSTIKIKKKEPKVSAIAGLKLNIKHTPGSSPPEIVAVVVNENKFPVSILSYESPLDPLAVALGQLEITPAGAKAPLELNKINVRRVWPPTRDQLITVGPGGSVMSSILLKEDTVPPGVLQGKVSMELKGRWQAVWSIRKENIPDRSLEDPFSSPEVEHGKYTTGKVMFHF
ncbi:unnamed protein product [Clonostachys rosea]|uniref:Late embryogenesis abundant protein LEA-2 subgroup domain-containing protein n=1 Tax=Bionectria ochroleuca TaxID=29856 RepID=A0ABY6UT42_BIOOC|nr:unnamed protein product [Clonostachys rosea]